MEDVCYMTESHEARFGETELPMNFKVPVLGDFARVPKLLVVSRLVMF